MSAVATQARPTVFLTSSLTDGGAAERVASLLDASGLEVVRLRGITPSGTAELHPRDAIRRSAAVVVVLSRATTSSSIPGSILFEIGAATGANKPVFVLLEDPSARLGFSVPDMHVLPMSRADEIGQVIRGLDS